MSLNKRIKKLHGDAVKDYRRLLALKKRDGKLCRADQEYLVICSHIILIFGTENNLFVAEKL